MGLAEHIPPHLLRGRRVNPCTEGPATGKSLGLPEPPRPYMPSQGLEQSRGLRMPLPSLWRTAPAWGPRRGLASGRNRTSDRWDGAELGRRA